MFWGMDEIDIFKFVIGKLMGQSYESIFLINVERNVAKQYCLLGQDEKREISTVVHIDDADSWLARLFGDRYIGPDLQSLLEEVQIKNMVKHLKEEENGGFDYSVYEKGEIRRKRIDYKYLYPDWNIICMTRKDVTDNYEEEQRKTEIVQRSLHIAQEAVQVKSDFLLNVSQDIRVPLNDLSGMLDLAIKAKKEGRDDTDFLIGAKKSMDRLNGMMADLLEMAVIEQGQIDIEKKPFVLSTFLKEMSLSLESLAKEKNQKIIFEVDSPNLNVVRGDPVYWRQVIMIIMENSLRYGREGGYAKCHFELKRTEDGESFIVMIFTDNGRGIPEEKLAKVFEVFYASGKDSNRGLGLPIAQIIVRKSGGNITIHSEVGVGTTVTVMLPIVEISEPEKEFKTKIDYMVRHMDELDFTKFKALIINADEIGSEVLELRLKKFGLQVDIMRDGQKALDCLMQSEEEEYHIVFSDIQLPNLSGQDLTRQLRVSSRRDLSDMPIVALTAHAYRDERIDALESGMDYHLTLPLNDIELNEILVRELFAFSPKRECEVRKFRIVK